MGAFGKVLGISRKGVEGLQVEVDVPDAGGQVLIGQKFEKKRKMPGNLLIEAIEFFTSLSLLLPLFC